MSTVAETFHVRPQRGDLGIEVEVEGDKLPRPNEYWRCEHDGSLRGESMEYVLQRPMSLSETRKALAHLSHCYKENGSQIADSPRCGVHVHVNCQKLTMTQLYNYFVIYLVLEDLLTKFCGKDREGNLFCLRAQDAEYLLYVLERSLDDGEFRRRFGRDEVRYAAMNVKALATYGSLEFRAMRGTEDMALIDKWATMLLSLRNKATEFEFPSDIVTTVSAGGCENFLRSLLPDDAEMFMAYDGWEGMLMDGVRRAQEIAFAIPWREFTYPKRTVGGIEVEGEWDDDFPPMDV